MIKREKRRKYCSGCTENFYNGNNPLGIDECWCLEDAKIVTKKFVHVDMRPPWNVKPEKTLSCHHRRRYVAVNKEVMH